jgi:hypothetical protein
MPWKGAIHHIIPAQAGIHFSRWNKTLAWLPAFAGTTLRPGFNRFADFFTRSHAGITGMTTVYLALDESALKGDFSVR